MLSGLPSAARLVAPVLMLSALLSLFGCGPARNTFAPPCPTARLIPALADMTRYDNPGTAHDVTDLVLQAQVTAVNGSCEAGSDPSQLPAKVAVSISVRRGPGMKGREADVPVFLAVTENDAVRDKKIFPVHVKFPPNVERLVLTSPEIDLILPVSADKSGAAYGIISGFQLSPDELTANRQASGS